MALKEVKISLDRNGVCKVKPKSQIAQRGVDTVVFGSDCHVKINFPQGAQPFGKIMNNTNIRAKSKLKLKVPKAAKVNMTAGGVPKRKRYEYTVYCVKGEHFVDPEMLIDP